MQHYDVRLKAILQKTMPGLLHLMGLPPVIEYLTVEFPKRQSAVPDMVMRLVDGRILHVELQAKNDPRMPWRCLEYWQAISDRWPGADVIQVVIYLGEGPMTMDPGIHRSQLSFQFQILELKDVPAGAFLDSESDGERILAVLCKSEDPRATIVAILASWRHLPVHELREKIDSLSVLSQLRNRDTMVKEEIETMPVDLDIRDNAFYRAGEAKVLTKFLERRFGPLPESIRTRISTADVASLDRWTDRMDTAPTLESIFVDN